jgi:uncharacterized protein YndB with AHSA1/START domain
MNPAFDIGVSRAFASPPRKVFDAWLDPEVARRFLFATPGGEMVRAEIDPRIGGQFFMTDRRDGTDFAHVGRFLEIDRPERLVFLVHVEPWQPDDAKISILIQPRDSGSNLELTVTADERWREHAERTRTGWSTILDNLARAIGDDPQVRPGA